MLAATWTTGAALGITIATIAWRLRALSGAGAVAAALLGTVAVAAGWSWAIVLLAYFVSSSALSRYRLAEKERRLDDLLDKGGRRDAAQVLANGAVFGVAAAAFAAAPSPTWQALGAGALAASAADTWATEIGTLARGAPRSIVTGRRVPVGTSGGITILGLVASVGGAAFVAGLALALGWPQGAAAGALSGGIAGSIGDSLLGATVQCRRHCPQCDVPTERRVHGCGTGTVITGGIRWLDNDGVNALSTATGALTAWLVSYAA